MAAEHQAAGGFLVQPVREARRARQAEAQRVEMILQARPALRPLVHGEAGGLVDDQHQPVAVEQAAPHLFRCHGQTGITAAGMSDSTDQVTGGNAAEGAEGGWWKRLTGGLKRSSSSLGTALSDLVTKRKLDEAAIEEIEEVLIRADL